MQKKKIIKIIINKKFALFLLLLILKEILIFNYNN
jgi:hypothetical protein